MQAQEYSGQTYWFALILGSSHERWLFLFIAHATAVVPYIRILLRAQVLEIRQVLVIVTRFRGDLGILVQIVFADLLLQTLAFQKIICQCPSKRADRQAVGR
jgi:hypothetical protein